MLSPIISIPSKQITEFFARFRFAKFDRCANLICAVLRVVAVNAARSGAHLPAVAALCLPLWALFTSAGPSYALYELISHQWQAKWPVRLAQPQLGEASRRLLLQVDDPSFHTKKASNSLICLLGQCRA